MLQAAPLWEATAPVSWVVFVCLVEYVVCWFVGCMLLVFVCFCFFVFVSVCERRCFVLLYL